MAKTIKVGRKKAALNRKKEKRLSANGNSGESELNGGHVQTRKLNGSK